MTAGLSNKNLWKFEAESDTLLEGQKMNLWCWATAARMFVKHYYDIPNERTQETAVFAVKGSVMDVGGNLLDSFHAACHYRSVNVDVNELGLVSYNHGRYSEETLRQFINDGHVLWIARGGYDEEIDLISGHAYLIAGYRALFINGTMSYKYIVYNPYPENPPNSWTEREDTLGRRHIWCYQTICNGKNEIVYDDTNKGIWSWSIVCHTEYSDQLIKPDAD